MSSSSAKQYDFLVIIPDLANSLQNRLDVRGKHLEALRPNIESGKVPFGGATLSKQPAEGEQPDMTGSVMLIKAESEEKIWEFIKGDLYAQGKVWDMEKVQVLPFRCAVRTAM